MRLEIITPETKIFTGEIEAVQLPGLDGSFQLLKGHAPIISALKEGNIKINLMTPFEREEKSSSLILDDVSDSKTVHVAIKGGIVELLSDNVIILAE
jgi:F-type H+-transporting ATPase subunit epsilon